MSISKRSSLFGSLRRNTLRSSTSSSSSVESSKSEESGRNQDIDPYFMKLIARKSEEYDLEQKIELEIKMQEGTSKLLAACRYQMQALEAAKSLLTSSERLNAYLYELQRRKSLKPKNSIIYHNKRFPATLIGPSKGKVAITDIRMPLIWKDSDHFKNRGDCRRFAVFCLLKLGTEVYDTTMLSNVDRSLTDIAFDDAVVFNRVPHDFEFRLEVYSYMLQDELSLASASNRLKKKISYSVSKAIGKKMVTNMKEDIMYKGGVPGMELVAHSTLRLDDTNSRIKTYDLTIPITEKSRQQLPLFGHFCCRMAVQPECMVEDVYTGYLSLVQQIGNLTGSRRMWCSLKDFSLSMWMSAGDMQSSAADMSVPVKQGTKVITNDNPNSYPRYSFRIENVTNGEMSELLLAADTSTELSTWISHIQQHIEDYSLWKPASEMLVDIPSPNFRRQSQFSRNRNSSLYDETPFADGDVPHSPVCDSSFNDNSHSSRLSTPPFWSSSSGSSTSNSIDLQTSSRPKSLYVKMENSRFQF